MSQARRLNLYRPLLAAQRQPALERRLGIACVVVMLILGVLGWQVSRANQAQDRAQKLNALVGAELEKQHRISGASEAFEDEKTQAQIVALEAQIKAKQEFLSDPRRFAPARINQWPGMVEVLERVSAEHPDAWIERFDMSGAPAGERPRVEIEGLARTQEAAFELIRTVSNTEPLSQLSLLETSLSPVEGARGAQWAFALKAGDRP